MQRLFLKIVLARLFGIIDVNTGQCSILCRSAAQTKQDGIGVSFLAGRWTLIAARRSVGGDEINCRFLHRCFLGFGLRSLQRLFVLRLGILVVLARDVEPNVPILSFCLRRQPLVTVY